MEWTDMSVGEGHDTYTSVWSISFNYESHEWLSIGMRRDNGKWEMWHHRSDGDTLLDVGTREEAQALALMLYKME